MRLHKGGRSYPPSLGVARKKPSARDSTPSSSLFGIFPASAVRELDPALYIYDPAYMQTAACKSASWYGLVMLVDEVEAL